MHEGARTSSITCSARAVCDSMGSHVPAKQQCSPRMPNLDELLSTLNNHAADYDFGKLQDIRAARRPLRQRPSRHPFRFVGADWAHHIGGREELQFNIGDDTGRLRWGIAISLEPSRSLPDVSVLYPKLRKLSSFLETHGAHLHRLGFEMWDVTDGEVRSPNRSPQRVPDTLYKKGSFIFVGKESSRESFDPERVLKDFDELLPIYEYVEFENESSPPACYQPRGFVFTPDLNSVAGARLTETTARRTVGDSAVSLHHRTLQDTLKEELQREGAEVGTELPDGKGGYIDLVARRDGALEFYEIKTDTSPRVALRNAIGQLLEYAYWPEPVKPARLVVVGDRKLDERANEYLSNLKAETGLTISYREVTPTK